VVFTSKITWHITLNTDNSYDKIIYGYFEKMDTSLTMTALVKEFLYSNITNQDLRTPSGQLEGESISFINDKLDLIIEKIDGIKLPENNNKENQNDNRAKMYKAIKDFEDSI
jgi:hypothetical protein